MSYYIAYGSNLSIEQMKWRCPGAVIAGKGILKGWKLAFGRHATIEPCEGAEVPVLIWFINERDEDNLDRYEGYPRYYYKKDLDAVMTDMNGDRAVWVTAMAYIMTDIQKEGTPSEEYVQVIREGYQRFNFDEKVLDNALAEIGCLEGKFERLTRWNGKKWVLPQGVGAWRAIADRLAAYENTGLTPEQIERMKEERK